MPCLTFELKWPHFFEQFFISFGSNSEFNSPTYCQPCQKSSKMAWGDKLKFFSWIHFFQRLSMPRPSVMLNSLFCQFWTNLAIFFYFASDSVQYNLFYSVMNLAIRCTSLYINENISSPISKNEPIRIDKLNRNNPH